MPIHGGIVVPPASGFAESSGLSNFEISPNSNLIAYTADQNNVGVTELYQMPVRGGAVEKLSAPMVNGGDVQSVRFSPDSSAVLYVADRDTDEVDELLSVATGEPRDPLFANGFE